MNPINYAINEVKFRIPLAILNIIFMRHNRRQGITLENRIINMVIRPRVLITSDLIGGREHTVPIYNLTPEKIDEYTVGYEIPLSMTHGVPIISAKYVSYYPSGFAMFPPNMIANNGVELKNAANQVMSSHSSIPIISTARVEIVGDNIIEVRDTVSMMPLHSLVCIIANDPWLNNLSPRSLPHFADACELAIKSYIYQNGLLDLDAGYLQHGQSMESVRNVIEQYADAEELYREFMRTKMAKVFLMNDENRYRNYIKNMISISA